MEFVALLISSLLAPAILIILQKKIKESHHALTANHHESDNPTILDLLDDLRDGVRATNEKLDRHIEWHLNTKDEK